MLAPQVKSKESALIEARTKAFLESGGKIGQLPYAPDENANKTPKQLKAKKRAISRKKGQEASGWRKAAIDSFKKAGRK